MTADGAAAQGRRAILAECFAGRISPQVALARLTLGGADADAVAALLAPCGAEAEALRRVLAQCRGGMARLAAVVAEAGRVHVPDGASSSDARSSDASSADTSFAGAEVARIAALFDRAVAVSPEAAVAAYSLGDAATLDAATAEIVAWLDGAGVLRGDVLDLGCGIGRVAAALAPRVRSVLGLDVSPAMVAEAGRRHGAVPGLRFEVAGGADLATLPDAAFDLALAVDSLPYLVQAGVAERHVADLARILRPGGALAILNLSYRGQPDADRADAARWAAAHGLRLDVADERPFALWDGSVFVLRRPR